MLSSGATHKQQFIISGEVTEILFTTESQSQSQKNEKGVSYLVEGLQGKVRQGTGRLQVGSGPIYRWTG